jgi:integrase
MEMAATAHLHLAAPANEKFTVQSALSRLPRRKPNAEYRSREHLTEREVERLIEVAKDNRWGHRDSTMVLIAFRHGLRASELVDLRWDQVDLEHALLHVLRLKNGSPATHPLTGKELRALRRLEREQELKSPFVFTSERGTPFTKRGFQAMVERAGKAIGFDVKIHPHMLRHACGFKLANDGVDTRTIQAYLGHKSIQHTVRYTELAPTRFKSLFRD